MEQIQKKDWILFLLGGLLYYYIEILWRGFSHISMLLCGGCCFVLIGKMAARLRGKVSLFIQMLLGSCLITSMELITGLIVNVWLKLNVWDYSELPMNLWGQVCLKYSIFWFFLTMPCIKMYDWIKENVFSI